MKTFFGGIFIEASKLKEAGIQYPIKVEYYKLKDEDNKKYGIEIIKIHIQKLKISTFFTLPIGIWVKGREVHSF